MFDGGWEYFVLLLNAFLHYTLLCLITSSVQLCAKLAGSVDQIRQQYWEYTSRRLEIAYGSAEEEATSSTGRAEEEATLSTGRAEEEATSSTGRTEEMTSSTGRVEEATSSIPPT